MKLFIEGKETRLKIGDKIIFRGEEDVVSFVRGSQRLLNQSDDKTLVDPAICSTEDVCLGVVGIIALTHGFGFKIVPTPHANRRFFMFEFTRLKRVKPSEEEINSGVVFKRKIRRK